MRTGTATEARVESLRLGTEPADRSNFLFITEEARPSGERVFAMAGTAANRGRPTDVNVAYPSMGAALEGAHWLATRMGIPVIYVRAQNGAVGDAILRRRPLRWPAQG